MASSAFIAVRYIRPRVVLDSATGYRRSLEAWRMHPENRAFAQLSMHLHNITEKRVILVQDTAGYPCSTIQAGPIGPWSTDPIK